METRGGTQAEGKRDIYGQDTDTKREISTHTEETRIERIATLWEREGREIPAERKAETQDPISTQRACTRSEPEAIGAGELPHSFLFHT